MKCRFCDVSQVMFWHPQRTSAVAPQISSPPHLPYTIRKPIGCRGPPVSDSCPKLLYFLSPIPLPGISAEPPPRYPLPGNGRALRDLSRGVGRLMGPKVLISAGQTGLLDIGGALSIEVPA
jgi:hypothetical protein